MSELPDLSAQKPYALDQLAQLQGKIVRLSQSMVLQRARIERCRQSDLAAARDIYAELSKTREALVEALAQTQLFLMEMEEYALAKVCQTVLSVKNLLLRALCCAATVPRALLPIRSLWILRGLLTSYPRRLCWIMISTPAPCVQCRPVTARSAA